MTEVFPGAPLTIPRISLISSADEVQVVGEYWYNEFQIYSEGCPGFDTFPICPSDEQEPKPVEPNEVVNPSYFPYVIYSTDHCSSWGYQLRDYWGRATRKELASESFLLEQQLWTDSLGLGNPHLADPALAVTVTSFDDSVLTGLAEMDQALADVNAARGMIHVRPRVLAFLAHTRAIRREGNLWLSPMDNIIVPGRGYPGTGPNGEATTDSTEWIYASAGIVQIRRGVVVVIPDENDYAAAMERPNNDIIVRAERVVHAALDPNCGVFAFQVDLETPAV